jgi:hypothetical protein
MHKGFCYGNLRKGHHYEYLNVNVIITLKMTEIGLGVDWNHLAHKMSSGDIL